MSYLFKTDTKRITCAWKIIIAWFFLVVMILFIAQEWVVLAFSLTYVVGFGGLAFRYRRQVRPFFRKLGLDNRRGFLLIFVLASIVEEVWCWTVGGSLAHPVLWVDLIFVTAVWSAWFGTWYVVLSTRYAFSEREALLLAASSGILYEYVGTGHILSNPLGLLIAAPLVIMVYAAIFILPMQLIDFTGEREGSGKYFVGFVMPFVVSIPIVFVLYIVFSLVGISTDS